MQHLRQTPLKEILQHLQKSKKEEKKRPSRQMMLLVHVLLTQDWIILLHLYCLLFFLWLTYFALYNFLGNFLERRISYVTWRSVFCTLSLLSLSRKRKGKSLNGAPKNFPSSWRETSWQREVKKRRTEMRRRGTEEEEEDEGEQNLKRGNSLHPLLHYSVSHWPVFPSASLFFSWSHTRISCAVIT